MGQAANDLYGVCVHGFKLGVYIETNFANFSGDSFLQRRLRPTSIQITSNLDLKKSCRSY